jgi:hypothetical protein
MRQPNPLKLLMILGMSLSPSIPATCHEFHTLTDREIASTKTAPISLHQGFDQLDLGMKLNQFIQIVGPPVRTIPDVRTVARWRKPNFEGNVIAKDGKIQSKELYGIYNEAISTLENYADIIKILGPPDQEATGLEYQWTDGDGCNMFAMFVKDQAVEMAFSCPSGTFGMKSGGLGRVDF